MTVASNTAVIVWLIVFMFAAVAILMLILYPLWPRPRRHWGKRPVRTDVPSQIPSSRSLLRCTESGSATSTGLRGSVHARDRTRSWRPSVDSRRRHGALGQVRTAGLPAIKPHAAAHSEARAPGDA
jgi:hypothetical protein